MHSGIIVLPDISTTDSIDLTSVTSVTECDTKLGGIDSAVSPLECGNGGDQE